MTSGQVNLDIVYFVGANRKQGSFTRNLFSSQSLLRIANTHKQNSLKEFAIIPLNN